MIGPGDSRRRAGGLFTVGVTGTNGKTSTTRWIAACLRRIARPVAQTTTFGSFLDDEPFPASRDFDGFLATLRAATMQGGRFAALELTSEALAKGFARAWPCDVGVFTNLTRDHLDVHGSMEEYLASKAQLFVTLPPGATAVLNAADPASELLREVLPHGVRLLRYAAPSRGAPNGIPDLLATRVSTTWQGTTLEIESHGELENAPRSLHIEAIGDVYAENALAALAASMACGVPPAEAAFALSQATPPPGRFQVLASPSGEGPRAVVDYAHTPDALERTLRCARALCEGTLVVVFGAGGDRDRSKREPMGAAAAAADRVFLTSDNPRGEDPAAIAAEIRSGLPSHARVEFESDRRAAIRAALAEAASGDVVVVAGKGHETEQVVGNRAVPFDDAAEVRDALVGR